MNAIFSSTPFILLLVLGSYLAGCKLHQKKHIALFHPLLVAMVLIIALLSLLDIDYDTFCWAPRSLPWDMHSTNRSSRYGAKRFPCSRPSLPEVSWAS
mgnify:CR=1 FL=1